MQNPCLKQAALARLLAAYGSRNETSPRQPRRNTVPIDCVDWICQAHYLGGLCATNRKEKKTCVCHADGHDDVDVMMMPVSSRGIGNPMPPCNLHLHPQASTTTAKNLLSS